MSELPDQHALAALEPAVRGIVAYVLGVRPQTADVEDCTSEVFRRALEGRDKLLPGAPLRPWVLGIARNVALDARRSRARALKRGALVAAGMMTMTTRARGPSSASPMAAPRRTIASRSPSAAEGYSVRSPASPPSNDALYSCMQKDSGTVTSPSGSRYPWVRWLPGSPGGGKASPTR